MTRCMHQVPQHEQWTLDQDCRDRHKRDGFSKSLCGHCQELWNSPATEAAQVAFPSLVVLFTVPPKQQKQSPLNRQKSNPSQSH